MTLEIKQLIITLLLHEDPDERRLAAEELGSSRDLAVVTSLTAALQDENKGVRDAASRSLLSIGGSMAARTVAHYITDENIATRNLAAKLLVQLGSVSVPAILPYLRDPSKDVRKLAVDILGEIKSEEPLYHLFPLLRDVDPNVMMATLEALGNIGSAEVIHLLCEAFESHGFARASIAEALGKIGNPASSDFLIKKFRQGVEENAYDPLVLFALIEAIGATGTLTALPVLLDQRKAVQGQLRSAMIHAIVLISERYRLPLQLPDEFRDDLLGALAQEGEAVKISAVKGLARFTDQEVTVAFLRTLGVSDELDFLIISELLKREDVFRIAAELLEQQSTKGKKQIILLLGKIAFELTRRFDEYVTYPVGSSLLNRAFESIAYEWHNEDQETQSIIVDSLFRLDGDRAVQLLGEIVITPDPWLRVHIIELLMKVSDRRALEFVARFLSDEDEMVREMAASTLLSLGSPLQMIESGACN